MAWFQINLNFAGRQYIGRRVQQEDYYAFTDSSKADQAPLSQLLLALGDGMGAHAGGEIASAHLVHQFIRSFKSSNLQGSWRLRVALEQANSHLNEISRRYDDTEYPMGSTFLGVNVTPEFCQWISVGDSPLYLYRDHCLTRLSADHSLTPQINKLVEEGKLSPQQAALHPSRNVLTSACMGHPLSLVDIRNQPFALQLNDILLACSDGVTSLSQDDIKHIIAQYSNLNADMIAQEILLKIRSINRVQQDNVTVGVICIKSH